MIETLYCSNGKDETRVRRAFSWVVTFRDFPEGSYQTVDGNSMMTEALTLFTKGRALFFLDGVQRADRVPGILSSEFEPIGFGGEFKLVYVQPCTRLCIPKAINRGMLPTVSKTILDAGEEVEVNGKFLVCLGSVQVNGKIFTEEKTFNGTGKCYALTPSIVLQFHDTR